MAVSLTAGAGLNQRYSWPKSTGRRSSRPLFLIGCLTCQLKAQLYVRTGFKLRSDLIGPPAGCGRGCVLSRNLWIQFREAASNNGTSKAETGNGEENVKIKACRLKGEEEETKMIINTINIIYFRKIPS